MSRSALVATLIIAAILPVACGCGRKAGPQKSPTPGPADFGYEYQCALEAGDKEKMRELVATKGQSVPEWLDNELLVGDYTVKGANGRPVMVLGDKQLTASDLSKLVHSVAQEYEAVSGDAAPLNKVKDWQKKHATEIGHAPLDSLGWDVEAFLREYKDALDSGSQSKLEKLVKGDGDLGHAGRVLDLAAYLQHIRPQYEAGRKLVPPGSHAALSYGGLICDPDYTHEDWMRVADSLAATVNRCHGRGKDIVGDYLNMRKRKTGPRGGG